MAALVLKAQTSLIPAAVQSEGGLTEGAEKQPAVREKAHDGQNYAHDHQSGGQQLQQLTDVV